MDLGASMIWMILAIGALGALTAVGALLLIKLQRHSQAPADADAEAVPTRPWSPEQRQHIKRNYFIAVMVVIAVLVVSGLALLGFAG